MSSHHTKAPLYCRRCRSADVRVSESQQHLRYRGKRRLHADVRCTHCGWRWWSRHHVALTASREADKTAYRRASEVTVS
jgi:RNase P subunit RPR2